MRNYYLLSFFLLFSFSSNAQVPELWGMTYAGGSLLEGSVGTIFKTDLDGSNRTEQYNFTREGGDGNSRGALCQALNGKIYGTSFLQDSVGLASSGGLYEFDPVTEEMTFLIEFDAVTTGARPTGHVIQAANGKLYGTNSLGGTFGNGTIYEYDITLGTLTVLHHFNDGNGDGNKPEVNLLEGSNGKLYGVTYDGGAYNGGTIFEYDITTATFTKLHDFDLSNNGRNPRGTLIEGANGLLYGTATNSSAGDGVIFSYNLSTNSYLMEDSFGGSAYALGGLVLHSNGMMYGMTFNGGMSNIGAIIEFNPSTSNITYVAHLQSVILLYPRGGLTEAPNGNLYGVASDGGANSRGGLLEYNPVSDVLTVKHDFDYLQGYDPYGTLMLASNGSFYGTTLNSVATSGEGSIFKYDYTLDSYQEVYYFGASLGNEPYRGSLIQASDGLFYGMTRTGGKNIQGSIFSFDPISGEAELRHSFDGANGRMPEGDLLEATNGLMYGVTSSGGTYSKGILFEFDPVTNALIVLHHFGSGGTDGETPVGTPIQASNGHLFGMTRNSGFYNEGTIYRYRLDLSQYITVKPFSGTAGPNEGAHPEGDLYEASNGMLYGMTMMGGTTDGGALFELDPNTFSYTLHRSFTSSGGGHRPMGNLIEYNNMLWGLTQQGGTSNYGVLFRIGLSGASYVSYSLTGSTGGRPTGDILLASNNMMYFMTPSYAANSQGALVEFNPASSVFTTKHDFDNTTGYGTLGHLIEANICHHKFSNQTMSACNSATVWGNTYTSSQIIRDTLVGASVDGCDSIRVMDLTIHQPVINNETPVISCDSAFVGGSWYYASQTITDFFPGGASTGCDSTSVTDVTINYAPQNIEAPLISCDSAQVNGNWYYTSQNVVNVIPGGATSGCDSTIITPLTINLPVINNAPNVNSCDSAQVNGNWYYTSQTVTDFFAGGAVTGCDSTVLTDVIINNSMNYSMPMISGCDSLQVNGNWYTSSQNVVDFYPGGAPNGCNLTVNTPITIMSGVVNNLGPVTACDSAQINGTWYFSSQAVTEVFPGGAATGCDSTTVVDLTINSPLFEWMPAQTGCDSIQVNGNWYTASQTVIDFTPGGAVNGCDLTQYTPITVSNPVVSTEPDVTACDSVQVSGSWYYTSQMVSDFYPGGAANGCDSTANTNVIVNESVTNTLSTVFACDSAQVGGSWYTISQTVSDFYPGGAANGCNLTVLTPIVISNSVINTLPVITTCDSVQVNGSWYYDSQDITEVFLGGAASGCDSTVIQPVAILSPTTHFASDITACDSAQINGNWYFTSQTITDLYPGGAANGCDSTVITELTIDPVVNTATTLSGLTIMANATGVTYQWIDCGNGNSPIAGETNQSFTTLQNGQFAVVITQGTCSDTSECVLIDHVSLDDIAFGKTIRMYPNPTGDNVTIEFSEYQENVRLEMKDISGKLMLSIDHFSGTSLQLDVQTVPKGLYFIQIESSTGKTVLKLEKM